MDQVLLALFGALVGFLLALIAQPVLQPRVDGLLAKLPFSIAIRRKRSIAGQWKQTWFAESTNYPRENTSEILLRQVGGSVSGALVAQGRTYRVEGNVEGDYFTGVWRDSEAGHTYHGAFQVRIYPNANHMDGTWIGYRTNGEIQSNRWEWNRVASSPA
jgi:hypothetical protein